MSVLEEIRRMSLVEEVPIPRRFVSIFFCKYAQTARMKGLIHLLTRRGFTHVANAR